MLTNRSWQEIAYISTAAHCELLKPINMCKISEPITGWCLHGIAGWRNFTEWRNGEIDGIASEKVENN